MGLRAREQTNSRSDNHKKQNRGRTHQLSIWRCTADSEGRTREISIRPPCPAEEDIQTCSPAEMVVRNFGIWGQVGKMAVNSLANL